MMTKEEILVELERRLGPLDERAREAIRATVDLIEPAPSPPPAWLTEPGFQGENPVFDPSTPTNLEARRPVLHALEEMNQDWLRQQCRDLSAGWLMVIDGQVVLHGPTLDNFPADEELLNLCHCTGKLPLLFIDDGLLAIEETTSWSSTIYPGDAYPTLSLGFRGNSSAVETSADLDTGAIELYADLDWLRGQGIVHLTPADQPRASQHLGTTYSYFTKSVTVVMSSTDGAQQHIRRGVICVQDWTRSPFVRINPARQVLLGRHLCFLFQPTRTLNFSQRTTKVEW